jgi:8-oxo-dGTP pyrophosphatase MutT (NUDIX family)
MNGYGQTSEISGSASSVVVADVTVCYIRRDGKLLLQLKDRGRFGAGYLNGPGGKVAPGESPEQAVRREVYEETGLRLDEVVFHGIMQFVFGMPEVRRLRAHVFSSLCLTGRARNRDEGKLRWYSERHLPYDRMWADNRFWLPVVLAGGTIEGIVWHDAAGREMLHCSATIRWEAETAPWRGEAPDRVGNVNGQPTVPPPGKE